ncbi:MAG: hypothetical protein HYW00_00865 [Candidatus Colwellbacteria bacterium]|nr:hypothetical protein [Candidatus Colwellbacteria bacterium]
MNQKLTFGLGIVVVITALFLGFVFGRYLTIKPYVSKTYPDIGGLSGSALGYLKDSQTVSGLEATLTLSGKITAVDDNGIVIAKESNPAVTITFNDNTIVLESPLQPNAQAETIKKEDLKVGDSVMVIGTLNSNELTADTVVRGVTAVLTQ